jgi:hypothetical protein
MLKMIITSAYGGNTPTVLLNLTQGTDRSFFSDSPIVAIQGSIASGIFHLITQGSHKIALESERNCRASTASGCL